MKTPDKLVDDARHAMKGKALWATRCNVRTLGTDSDAWDILKRRLEATLDDGIAIGRQVERQIILQKLAELLNLDLGKLDI